MMMSSWCSSMPLSLPARCAVSKRSYLGGSGCGIARISRVGCRASSSNSSSQVAKEELSHYQVLGVSRTASPAEIKSAWRQMQKKHHPDVYDGDQDMSSRINEAYKVLSDAGTRRVYDRSVQSKGSAPVDGGTPREGIVGPLRVDGAPLMDVDVVREACPVELEELDEEKSRAGPGSCFLDTVHRLRQWASTLAYGADLAMPLPLSVDAVENGTRVAFVGFSEDGFSPRVLGELTFVLEENEQSDSGPFRAIVQRSSTAGRVGALPGEQRVLKAFARDVADGALDAVKVDAESGLQAKGIVALALGQFMGMVPFGGSVPGGSGMAAYYLPSVQEQEQRRSAGQGVAK